MHKFEAELKIIGINPYVFVPDEILSDLFRQAEKSKGPIRIRGLVNEKPYQQTLVKYRGAWRLYVNAKMLENSPRRIGEIISLSLEYDPGLREIDPHPELLKALDENVEAKTVYESLPASLKKEIVRYISNLKTDKSREKNIKRAIGFLLGKERFIGRDILQRK